MIAKCFIQTAVGAVAIQSSYASRVSRPRRPSPIALVVLLCGLSGCERGCLSTWLGDPGAGGRGPNGSGGQDAAHRADLGGTDCSDGLARCVDGRVETSLAGHVPHPCTNGRERGSACECPWAQAGKCASDRGCVKDGLEVVAPAEIALAQLCKPDAPVVRAVVPAESAGVAICADDAVSCADGVVRTCATRGQPTRLVTACVWGCAPGIRIEPEDLLTGDGAAVILCRRAHAERR